MKVIELKQILKQEGLPYWKIADALQVSENTIGRLLRNNEAELSTANKAKLLNAVNSLISERQTAHYE